MTDFDKIRNDFPILSREVHGKPLVYLDSGATTQKPQVVVDKINHFYKEINSNIHRAVHHLSSLSTEEYENSRKVIAEFINAKSTKEIVFTKGTTDAINLVAYSFGEKYINEGDEILVSEIEHHSNIVPWQLLCERKKAVLKVIPVNDEAEIIMEEFEKLLSAKTKLVSVAQVSNAFGTIHPIKEIIEKTHNVGAKILIDGAQGIQHLKTDVQELDCDFYVFSGHKIYAENGIGVLYGKEEILLEIPPYQGGGDMVDKVSFEKTTYAELPLKFEAGTSNYVGAASIAAAIQYLSKIGLENIEKYEHELLEYAEEKLSQIEGLKFYGTAKSKSSAISFLIEGVHPLDAGMVLDKLGIAVRTGSHCVQPGMTRFGIDGTIRASLALYNNKADIDALYDGLLRVKRMFS